MRRAVPVSMAALVVATAWLLLPRSPSRITEVNFNRLLEGMPFPEAEALLGPPGDYRTGPTVSRTFEMLDRRYLKGPGSIYGQGSIYGSGWSGRYEWKTDTADVAVSVMPLHVLQTRKLAPGESPVAVVVDATYCNRKPEFGPIGNLFWRVKQQWRKWFPE
jgi:hypothetical protein